MQAQVHMEGVAADFHDIQIVKIQLATSFTAVSPSKGPSNMVMVFQERARIVDLDGLLKPLQPRRQ